MNQHDDKELKLAQVRRDPRPLFDKFGGWLSYPQNYAKTMFILAGVVMFAPISIPVVAPIILASLLWYSWQKPLAALRYPMDLGGRDPTWCDPEGTPLKGEGIMFLGNERNDADPYRRNREVWLTNSDARTHMLLLGVTGAGKTESLLSFCFNALAWGSGYVYTDGKADNDLYVKNASMVRRVGRDDDLLVLNFLTGGRDQFIDSSNQAEKHSNTMNSFYDGSASFLSNLITSLLPKATGEAIQWQQKAVNMMDAVIYALCYLRARSEVEISAQTLREYMALPKIIELYLRDDIQRIDAAYRPIKAYLETGLPGFSVEKALKNQPQDQVALEQHGYRTGQFAKVMSMFMDTYGYIFKDRLAEVDMQDVLLNRRILVVMIPTLEKSDVEAANLGKLVISSIRLMMAMNLGNKLEGYYKDIIEAKATNSPSPAIIAYDEIGYYFAPGVNNQVAQGRSLGFMFIVAGQDVEAMERGENKEEVQSVLANTKTKIALAQEAGSASKTFEVFEKSAGEQFVSQLSGFEARITSVGSLWRNMQTSGIERVSRLDIRELRSLDKGHGVALFMDRLIRFKSFYVFKKAKVQRKTPYRVNRFIQCMSPTLPDIRRHCKSLSETLAGADKLLLRLREGAMVTTSSSDRVASAIHNTLKRIGDLAHERARASMREGVVPEMPPAIELGIALYVSALEALESETQVPEPIMSRQSSVRDSERDRPPLGAPAGATNAANLAAPILAEEFDALAYLDNPPIVEKPASDLLANKVEQAKPEKTAAPVSQDAHESNVQRWLEDAIESAYSGDARAATATAAARPVIEGAKEARQVVGFKPDVLESLQNIEVMNGSAAPQDEAVKYEQEVSQAMEWRPETAGVKEVPEASTLSQTDIEHLFSELKESIK